MGLTEREIVVLNKLADAWNEYCELEILDLNEKNEFMQAIHKAEYIVAFRVARRVDPDIWK